MPRFSNPIYPVPKNRFGFPYSGQMYSGMRIDPLIESPLYESSPYGDTDDVMRYRGKRLRVELPYQDYDPTQPRTGVLPRRVTEQHQYGGVRFPPWSPSSPEPSADSGSSGSLTSGPERRMAGLPNPFGPNWPAFRY